MSLTAYRPLSEITEVALRLLIQEMGVVNTVRFINQFHTGHGDAIAEKDRLFGAMTVEEIADAIKQIKQLPAIDVQHQQRPAKLVSENQASTCPEIGLNKKGSCIPYPETLKPFMRKLAYSCLYLVVEPLSFDRCVVTTSVVQESEKRLKSLLHTPCQIFLVRLLSYGLIP